MRSSLPPSPVALCPRCGGLIYAAITTKGAPVIIDARPSATGIFIITGRIDDTLGEQRIQVAVWVGGNATRWARHRTICPLGQEDAA